MEGCILDRRNYIKIGKEMIQRNDLKNATDALVHRGPDGEGFWFSENKNIALGHRRLSIIDLDTGDQPLSNEDDSIHQG